MAAMHPALPLALLALLAPAAARGEGGKDPLARESLEDLLARAKAQRQAVQQRINGDVLALVKELESGPAPDDLARHVDRLVALGEEAAPLLVPYLDAGDAATDKERLRAQQVALALVRIDTSAITAELLTSLASASLDGKRNTLRVLQSHPDRERTRPAIEALFRASEGNLKRSALRTLIAIGGPETDTLLAQLLAGSDDALIALALEGLAEAKSAGAVAPVRGLLAQSSAGRARK